MYKFLVLTGVLIISVVSAQAEGPHGFQILGKVIRQFINSQPEDLTLGDGVHLVNTRSENDARSASDDSTVLGSIENYLQNHELRIRLPELMPGEGFGRAFKTAMDGIEKDESTARQKGGGGLGGGGGKGGGGGGIMLLGLMMGKMLAALGIGGVGLLAMKALMVSALALMLSTIIGLKKLVHSGHDDGGGHTVIHASHGHGHEYRKKREAAANMAYQGWQQYKTR